MSVVTCDALEAALTTILDPMGVRALGTDRKVLVDPGTDRLTIRLALPAMRAEVVLDGESMRNERAFGMYALERLEHGARVLFRHAVDHIAKHDRSPIDRVKDLEAAAVALLDVMGAHLNDIRMPHGSSSAVANAAYKLRELVEQKKGAASWSRNGYGEDPPEVVETYTG